MTETALCRTHFPDCNAEGLFLSFEHSRFEFVSACPGATSLGHSVVAAVFRNSSSGPHSLKARSGPGISTLGFRISPFGTAVLGIATET